VRLARQAALSTQPTQSLRAITELRTCLNTLEAAHVDAALQAGCSWSTIAQALGVSRQSAHRKHAARRGARVKTEALNGNSLVIVAAARVAVVMGRQEAAAVQSRTVGTEHLLVGLVRQGDGGAAVALAALGATLEKVRHCARACTDRARGEPETDDLATAPGAGAGLPLSRRGREALEQSLREAVSLGEEQLDSEHLLLALLRDDTSRAVACLRTLRITPAAVEAELARRRSLRGASS